MEKNVRAKGDKRMKWLEIFKNDLLFKGIMNDFKKLVEITRSIPSYYGVRYEEQTTIKDKAVKELDALELKIKEIVDEKLSTKITSMIMSELYDSLSETMNEVEKE